jgi:D-alanyl-lipoteichoic acid acyltransferase DltB (MBOAT superfamily)
MPVSSSVVAGELQPNRAPNNPLHSANRDLKSEASEPRDGTAGRRVGFALILAQVILVVAIIRQTDIGPVAFHRTLYLATLGFLINHLLPMRWRPTFFTLLSVAGLLLVMGGSPTHWWDPRLALPRSATTLAAGGLLIGICLLPIGFWKRAVLLLTAGTLAALFRAGVLGSGSLAIVWPVLAAMFMFRVMIYLYDVSTSKKLPTLNQSLSYFFLIPNSCVLFFPVIDFRAFCSKYYSEDSLAIYQRGVKWMGRGVVHLLIYRLVSQLVALDATAVANGTDVIQYIVANSFLYLKVSGEFHLYIGMLLLFGFNLPETNHRYFLAASFTDYWRRVNIYWKDFIMKVFYYPTFFKIKKIGQAKALVLATLWCFVLTWGMHAYQTWWIKGSVSFTWPDGLFWGILGLLVVANSLWEMKRGRQRKLANSSYSLHDAIALMIKTAATFTVISLLWALWSTPSVGLFLHICSLADRNTLAWAGAILIGIMIATIIFEILPSLRNQPATAPIKGNFAVMPRFRWEVAQCALPLLAIFVIVNPHIQARINSARWQPYKDALAVGDKLSSSAGQGRGYYESLTAVDAGAQQFWETVRVQPFEHKYVGPDPVQPVNDFRFRVLIPNVHEEAYGADFQTNRWGMHDRDHDLVASPGTFRIALLGSSHVMGYGLKLDQMFASKLETELNSGRPPNKQFEILNFAVNGYSPLAQLEVVNKSAAQFHPDIVIHVAHFLDFDWINRDPPRALRTHVPIPYDYLNQVLTDARITPRTNESIAADRLYQFEPPMLSFTYKHLAHEISSIGAQPVLVFLPLPDELPVDKSWAAQLMTLAKDAGFIVIDFSDIYEGQDPRSLMLSESGDHSNDKANSIIAAALYKQLTTDPRINLLNRVPSQRDGAGQSFSSSGE